MLRKWSKALMLIWISMALVMPSMALADESGSTDTTKEEQTHKGPSVDLAPHARAAILLDVASGTVLYEKNIHEQLPPASITKIMTMLLVLEAIEDGKLSWDEKVTASEHAASMGGSQIFLEAGEQMTVTDLMKGVAMASGNDASVALAEKIAGSEQMFVQMMNERASELGMKNTHFVNTNGLPADNHVTTAYDIALMSQELLKHERITEFTGKYEDYLRKDTDKPFWLVNTNKLVRFYAGADGLKTGYTSKAKYGLSATAKRDNMRVIAVVLGEPDTKTRNAEVSSLFDYAFSQYMNVPLIEKGDSLGVLQVEKGNVANIELFAPQSYSILLRRGTANTDISHEVVLERKEAPIQKGEPIGKIVVKSGDEIIKEFTIAAPENVEKAGWWQLFKRTMSQAFLK